jgi:coniferyl-aldehyde dehydrogenase
MADELVQLFERQRAAFAREPMPDHATRMGWLRALQRSILSNEAAILAALDADFGGRSRHESTFIDVFAPLSSIRYAISHLRSWMTPQRRQVDLFLIPSSAEVLAQPKGVVGIIAPWNYPFYLSLAPLAAALAAGNRVLLKPSETTPRCAELMRSMLARTFDEDLVAVLTGGPEVAQALVAMPLDHIFYTGSATGAKAVLRAAAEHLTPVTLELGGKSPAIVHENYAPERAAKRIAVGKFFNAGQTCVAPDYVLVQSGRRDALAAALQAELQRSYPQIAGNEDYTAIVDARHRQRLRDLVDDAVARGATIVQVAGEQHAGGTEGRKMTPTLLLGVDDSMQVMQEEIFGPVLPLVAYERLEDAIAFVNRRPRPLALYYFDDDRARADRVLAQTISGGASINETALHVLDSDLPFGGIGASGTGAYHGKAGFDTFSHRKAVLRRGRPNTADLLVPPYGRLFERVMRYLIGSKRGWV